MPLNCLSISESPFLIFSLKTIPCPEKNIFVFFHLSEFREVVFAPRQVGPEGDLPLVGDIITRQRTYITVPIRWRIKHKQRHHDCLILIKFGNTTGRHLMEFIPEEIARQKIINIIPVIQSLLIQILKTRLEIIAQIFRISCHGL